VGTAGGRVGVQTLGSDVWSHDLQEMIGEHWLPEKRRSREICRNLARIGPRNEYERDMAMRELLRDRIRHPVGDLYVQNSKGNVSVEQRHRARDTAGGLSAAAQIILHQPRHGLGDDGIIFNNEDALLHPNQRGALPIVPAPRPLVIVNVNNYVNLKWTG